MEMEKAIRLSVVVTLALWLGFGSVGCVRTTRIVTDAQGRTVEETTTSWEPSVVVYGDEPPAVVYYREPVRPVVHYWPSRSVVYSTYPMHRRARAYYGPPHRPTIYPVRHRHHR